MLRKKCYKLTQQESSPACPIRIDLRPIICSPRFRTPPMIESSRWPRSQWPQTCQETQWFRNKNLRPYKITRGCIRLKLSVSMLQIIHRVRPIPSLAWRPTKLRPWSATARTIQCSWSVTRRRRTTRGDQECQVTVLSPILNKPSASRNLYLPTVIRTKRTFKNLQWSPV